MINEQIKYANNHGYSDVHPYEIVRVISGKTIEVRAMASELSPEWKPEFYVGGFSGHCHNQHSQKWIITSNPSAPVVRIRLTKKGWHGKAGRFVLSEKPVRFYDYNF